MPVIAGAWTRPAHGGKNAEMILSALGDLIRVLDIAASLFLLFFKLAVLFAGAVRWTPPEHGQRGKRQA